MAAGAKSSRALPAAALLVALQGAGLLGIAAYYLVGVAVGRASEQRGALVSAALALLAGLALLLVARGLGRARRWARAPALLAQLLVLPVAATPLQGEQVVLGAALLAWALAALVLLLLPAVGAALQD
ncbi:MAG: hypothetical protein M3P96_06935 [Actinomycetota bacterium]|nr:hypothetical protein [Actinomycetota bacterium]